MTLLCTVSILTLNTKIVVELVLFARRRAMLTAGQETRPPTGLIVNLFVIVTIYILLSLPSLRLCYVYCLDLPYKANLGSIWYFCNCINSTVNFAVYCLCFKNFRKTVRLIISRRLDKIRRIFDCKTTLE